MRSWYEGGLGWDNMGPITGGAQVSLACRNQADRRICAVETGTARTAWLTDLGYVNAHGCVRQGSSCTTNMGNAGAIYCCPSGSGETVAGGGSVTKPGPTGGTTTTTTGGKAGVSGGACSNPTSPGGSTYWRNVQNILCTRGFSPGTIDGVVGRVTRTAIEGFQRANSLPVTGRIDSATASALGVTAEPAGGGGGGGGGGGTPTPTPPEQEEAGIFDFIDVRSPFFWLAIAGVVATVGGTAYWYRKRSRASKLAEMSDTGIEREIYEAQAAAEESQRRLPRPRRAK